MSKSNPMGLVCKECGSRRIVPIIYGNASDEMLALALLENADLGGSFGVHVGSPLWSCNDCGESISDEGLVITETGSLAEREHDRTIQELLRGCRHLSQHETSCFVGKGFLKTIARREVHADTTRIVISTNDEGFLVSVHSRSGITSQQYGSKDKHEYKCMLSFLGGAAANERTNNEKRSTVVQVRVGRHDQNFSVWTEPTADSEDLIIVAVPLVGDHP
jgi:hypothetical protein